MVKALTLAILAAVIGLVCGRSAYQSRFGGDSAFGPFAADSDVTAESVSLAKVEAAPAKFPKLELVGDDEYDFGVMEPGGEASHSFIVRNVGEAPLEIDVSGSTCKCTVGSLEQSKLAPGEQTEVKLTWVAKTDSELFGQSATLRTNDPSQGELSLKVRGRVISSMTMVPRTLSFGDVEAGSPIVLESTLFSFSKTPIVAVEQEFSDPSMTAKATFEVEEVSVESTGEAAYASATQAFKIRAEIDPGLRQGPLRENFVFKFAPASAVNSEGAYDPDSVLQFTAETTGKVVGVITLVESRRVYNGDAGYIITMGEIDPTADSSTRVNIMLRGPQRESIRLTVGDVEPAGILKAELGEPVGRSTTVLVPLILSVAEGAEPIDMMGRGGNNFGIVWLEADDPDVSPLRLRVRFEVPQ